MSDFDRIKRVDHNIYGRIKGYSATTHIDLHGEKLSLKDLHVLEEFISKNPFIYVNHDESQPPVSKVVDHKIVELPDKEYAIEVIAEIFDQRAWEKIKEKKLYAFSYSGVRSLEKVKKLE